MPSYRTRLGGREVTTQVRLLTFEGQLCQALWLAGLFGLRKLHQRNRDPGRAYEIALWEQLGRPVLPMPEGM